MNFNTIFTKLSLLRTKIQPKHFVLFLSLVVGLLSGLAVVVIKNSVHFIQNLLTLSLVKDYQNYLFFVYPFIGLLLTTLFIKFVIKKPIGHGIPNTLFAISRNNSVIKAYNMFASIVASAFTVGFGGSVGLEGPTVSTNSAIGSNIAQLFKVDYKTATLLVGCGAAGAMSGIFNAPIAALVFVLEVFMFDLSLASMIPFLMASVSAALSSRMVLGNNVLFDVKIHDAFVASEFPYFILLGIFTGLISVYFNKMFWLVEGVFEKIKQQKYRLIIGGVLLGGLIFLVPPLYGEGFETITALLKGDFKQVVDHSLFFDKKEDILIVLGLLFGIIFLKVIASAITFGAGGIGGVFAPSLFMGATSGFVFAKTLNIFRDSNLSETNFTLVGMAGLIAGVLHAPLTSLFLIAEITKGYELIIPLMITAAIAYLTSKYFVPYSVYTMQLAKRGQLITRHKDKAVLTLMKLHTEVEKDFNNINPSANLGDLVKIVSKSKRNLFPVVDESGILHGIITLDDIREIMFKPEMYNSTSVKSLMIIPQTYVHLSDNMDVVMQKFSKSKAWNLPVIDGNKYVGFVSKSKLFNAYRKLLVEFSEE
ncbi:chloride channel protein [Vicingus serpentipes]|uniref:Chloride channel protein n=1 Tax=Vicingus serpentipes TaxID=1926625 RepID=A0A5C6RQG7_9FLAO|nr:chloride channel protein [Vicingus serpentipes]